MLPKAPWRKPYLLVLTNLYCNHQCSYCIQQQSSLDVRLNSNRVDVPAVLRFLKRNRIDRSVKVAGGEATLHPDFEMLIDGLLKLYRRVVLTTNVNGKWFKDFDRTLATMKRWKRVRWNTTYHPAWMDLDVYIERVRAMREAGLDIDQVTATDTPELSDDEARKLEQSGIGWALQNFTGRGPDGRLLPQSWDDIRTQYPQLWDASKYIEHYGEYRTECEDANFSGDFFRGKWVDCTTARFLIGPDNKVYPCHRHLYVADPQYALGSLEDVEMKNFSVKWNGFLAQWTLPCHTKCNPCDFRAVKIRERNTASPSLVGVNAPPAPAGR